MSKQATCGRSGAFQQPRDRRQVVRLVQGRERDQALERFERRWLHPYRSRVLESSVDDPVPDAHQAMIREVVLQEVTEILDRAIVTECHSTPRLLGHDAARRVVRLETRRGVQAFDLAPKLERELTGTLREYGELDARGAAVQNENGVVGFSHGYRLGTVSRITAAHLLTCRHRRGGQRTAPPRSAAPRDRYGRGPRVRAPIR